MNLPYYLFMAEAEGLLNKENKEEKDHLNKDDLFEEEARLEYLSKRYNLTIEELKEMNIHFC